MEVLSHNKADVHRYLWSHPPGATISKTRDYSESSTITDFWGLGCYTSDKIAMIVVDSLSRCSIHASKDEFNDEATVAHPKSLQRID